jgi:hypothetical protein
MIPVRDPWALSGVFGDGEGKPGTGAEGIRIECIARTGFPRFVQMRFLPVFPPRKPRQVFAPSCTCFKTTRIHTITFKNENYRLR